MGKWHRKRYYPMDLAVDYNPAQDRWECVFRKDTFQMAFYHRDFHTLLEFLVKRDFEGEFDRAIEERDDE